MDRIIEKKKWTAKKISYIAIAILFAILLLWGFIFRDKSNKLNVERAKLSISKVTKGPFQEYIPVDGIVQPIRTIYLDAINGGKVEKLYVEDGAYLKKGDTILKLSNTSLQLDYMNRETQMVDIINNLQNTKLQLEQNHFLLKKQLLEIDYQLDQFKKEFQRKNKLYAKGVVSEKDFDDAKRNFEYYKQKRIIAIESQKHDSIAALVQLKQLKRSLANMEKNMAIVKENLERLFVKAPVDGRLSSFNVEIGENKINGQRLGQIDILDGFKLNAPVDERYISRVYLNQNANFDLNGKHYNLMVQKIYPDVKDGSFRVDFIFTDNAPKEIKRGQTILVKLEFSDVKNAIMIKRGGFYQETGGHWIFVVKDGIAEKRPIKIGRQNVLYYEILDGLKVDEEVIISSYTGFEKRDKLILK